MAEIIAAEWPELETCARHWSIVDRGFSPNCYGLKGVSLCASSQLSPIVDQKGPLGNQRSQPYIPCTDRTTLIAREAGGDLPVRPLLHLLATRTANSTHRHSDHAKRADDSIRPLQSGPWCRLHKRLSPNEGACVPFELRHGWVLSQSRSYDSLTYSNSASAMISCSRSKTWRAIRNSSGDTSNSSLFTASLNRSSSSVSSGIAAS